jgi:hypothetical protein
MFKNYSYRPKKYWSFSLSRKTRCCSHGDRTRVCLVSLIDLKIVLPKKLFKDKRRLDHSTQPSSMPMRKDMCYHNIYILVSFIMSQTTKDSH